MATDHNSAPSIETIKDAVASGEHPAGLWLKRIARAQDDEEDHRKDAQEAIDVYEAKDVTNFNVWHSNVETLRPTIYNSEPIPDIRRRFDDGDQLAKDVVDLAERTLTYTTDTFDINAVFRSAVRDAVVTGRGVARIRYTPTFNDQGLVAVESVTLECVRYDRFIRGPALAWADMPWIAIEHHLKRDELTKLNPKFGQDVGVGDPSNDQWGKKAHESDADPDKGVFLTARVYEIWDRDKREVSWVAHDEPDKWLKAPDSDPLGLEDFFPVLKPLQPSSRVSSLTPITPYKTVKPLYDELELITRRIKTLISHCKARGIVAAEVIDELELLRTAEDGEFISAKNTAQFSSGAGGLDSAIHYWPLADIVTALQVAQVHRTELLAQIDQVSGVSDILRGQVDPREKLGQSNLKAQFGGVRIQEWQNDVAQMAREFFRKAVELFAGKFSDQSLVMMSGMPSAQDQEAQARFPQVLKMFRSQLREFRIDIETDSTIRADLTRAQEQFTNFLGGTAQFAQAAAGLIPIAPTATPVIIEVYTAFARKFKLGKQAEDALDRLSLVGQQVQENAEQEQQSDPEADAAQAELAMKQATHSQDIQQMQEKHQLEMQQKQEQHQLDMQIEQQKAGLKIDADSKVSDIDIQHKTQSANIDLDHKSQAAGIDIQVRKVRGEQDVENKQRSDEQALDAQRQKSQAANGTSK